MRSWTFVSMFCRFLALSSSYNRKVEWRETQIQGEKEAENARAT